MDNKITLTSDPNNRLNKPILSEYENIVKLEYANVPMNVTSVIGHHLALKIPNSCTYTKKK